MCHSFWTVVPFRFEPSLFRFVLFRVVLFTPYRFVSSNRVRLKSRTPRALAFHAMLKQRFITTSYRRHPLGKAWQVIWPAGEWQTTPQAMHPCIVIDRRGAADTSR